VRERRPGTGWTQHTPPAPNTGALASSCWTKGPILVISELVLAELPDGSGIGEQWLVSVSRRGKRPKPHDVRKALRAFGMVGAEQDNHHPGVAHHYWRPVDPERRVDCECKADERIVTDADGYQWTTPVDGPCRGCELEGLTGKPCPLHPKETDHV
jgi:hypothetical protein